MKRKEYEDTKLNFIIITKQWTNQNTETHIDMHAQIQKRKSGEGGPRNIYVCHAGLRHIFGNFTL